MKKKITSIALLLASLVLWNCTDLQEEPRGLLAPEAFFKSVNDVEAGLFGAYSQLVSNNLYGRELSVLLMLREDMGAIGDQGTTAERKQIDEFNMNSENGLSSNVWQAFYRTISAANTTMQAARTVPGDEARKKGLEAEARFVRAFSYFSLVRLFGDVPYLDGPVETTAQLKNVRRTPEADIYGHIVQDLSFAKQNLPHRHPGDVRNRATSGTAATVLADVYLTLGQYGKAAEEARYVIRNANGLYNYALEKNYQDLFNGNLAASLKEPIFVTDWHNTLSTDGVNEDWLISMTRVRGLTDRSLSVVVPTMKVYTTWDPRDYRRAVSFEDSVMVSGVKTDITKVARVSVKRPHIAKYFRFPGPQNGGDDRRADNDYHIYRYADVLLMAAEAIAESEGATPEAIGYVNEVRKRARFNGKTTSAYPFDVPATVSKAEFIALVREERRLELAFEFKRWFDIKRWKVLDKVFSGPDALETRTTDPSRDYLMPLPLSEIRLNGWAQNPGY
jgi:starch-binding outer membrane protein, SusD/RagB family